MSKTFKLLAMAGIGVGLLAFAPNAQAHAPDVTALECVVDGSVTTDFHHYDFVSSTLTCSGTFEGAPIVDAVYDVNAGGDTKSNLPAAVHPAGTETCDEGASDGPGTLTASSRTAGLPDLSGSVEFVRVGTAVEASGTLSDSSGHGVDFVAELVFTPNDPTALTECDALTFATPASMDAGLTGLATVVDSL